MRLTARPLKEFKTIDEQLQLLIDRGMAVDAKSARRWLELVGYYRLSGYSYPYRQFASGTRESRADTFIPGTEFSSVTALYEFDRKLRSLVFDALERVEIAVRTQLSHHIGSLGPLSYYSAATFRQSSFDHAKWIQTAHKRVNRSRRQHEPIRHHDQYYNGQLPVWVLVDVLDFSDVSRGFEGLPAQAQWTIGDNLGINVDLTVLTRNQQRKALSNHPLVRWLEQLTVVRNTCAHHSRMWNRSFTPVGTAALRTIDGLDTLPESQSERLYGALLLIGRLLHTISPGTSWPAKVRELVIQHLEPIPGRSAGEMGFPTGWENEPIWRARLR